MMKIGVIGPRDSLNNIMEIESEFKETVQFTEYEANSLSDCIKVTNECQPDMDGILFSGRAIYDVVSRLCQLNICNRYVVHNETSILSILAKEDLSCYDYLSVDFLDKKIAIEAFNSSQIKNFGVIGSNSGKDEQDYIRFHLANNAEHKNVAVLTCFPLVVDALRELNIPVFRLHSTVFSIRNEINQLISDIHNKRIDDSKISVQVIHLKINNQRATKTEALSKVLQFERTLIHYLQIVKGAVFNYSRNEYIIFSTKGLLTSDEAKNAFYKIITLSKFVIHSGIGVGTTAAMAEVNANKAIEYSLSRSGSSFYIISENDILEGPILHKNILEYKVNTVDSNFSEVSLKTGLSDQYLQKIHHLMLMHKKDYFSANEISEYLEISQRSARRILKQLSDGGCAEVFAKEQCSGSGRPQSIYRIKLTDD